jgi:hypothetical protein
MAIGTAYVDNWRIGVQSGDSDDFWVRAEKFVARKRAGEIEGEIFLQE